MLTGSLLLVALVITAFLIHLLHKHQVSNSQDGADRSSPLPPLEQTTPDECPKGTPVNVANAVTSPGLGASSWQEEVRQLRKQGQFQQALSLCRRQYPKMLALKQTLVTLRAKMRNDQDQSDDTLQVLYKTAILGSWAQQSRGTVDTDDAIYRKLESLESPGQYWDTVGYKHLRLLSKTDSKLLVARWGEPRNHSDINSVLGQMH